MPDKIKVGVLTHGGGAHVGAYLEALAASKECGEVVFADPDKRWEAAARSTLGEKLTRTYTSHDQLLARESPELAVVTMEAKLAPPVIDRALDAQCHVFAEKPSCVRVEDFAPLVEKADRQHRYLMLALANRTNPEITEAKRLIAAGEIGKLYGVEIHLVADQTRLTRQSFRDSWMCQKARAGGGHLIWLGIHWLDLAMYVTDSEITDVAAFTANVGGQPIDIEDSATAALRFNNGTLGTVTSGYYLDKGYHSNIKIWGAGFAADESVTVVAVAASSGADRILVGTDANSSGAFMVESSNSLAVGVYTVRADGDMGSKATAPLVIVEEK